MKLVKEYISDDTLFPSDDEIKECVKIANDEDCIVRLKWYVEYSGWYTLTVTKGMTFDECRARIPTCYPL